LQSIFQIDYRAAPRFDAFQKMAGLVEKKLVAFKARKVMDYGNRIAASVDSNRERMQVHNGSATFADNFALTARGRLKVILVELYG
jgi:hypothetical protein